MQPEKQLAMESKKQPEMFVRWRRCQFARDVLSVAECAISFFFEKSGSCKVGEKQSRREGRIEEESKGKKSNQGGVDSLRMFAFSKNDIEKKE
ncbi:hypothetical protein L1887_24888 [Cichorium endivia]|nr:hypothetical protein L1887_24888 [Cichorium endivia]